MWETKRHDRRVCAALGARGVFASERLSAHTAPAQQVYVAKWNETLVAGASFAHAHRGTTSSFAASVEESRRPARSVVCSLPVLHCLPRVKAWLFGSPLRCLHLLGPALICAAACSQGAGGRRGGAEGSGTGCCLAALRPHNAQPAEGKHICIQKIVCVRAARQQPRGGRRSGHAY